VTWRSDDTTIATVDSTGVVTARDAGSVTINATAESVTGSALINVENPVATVDVTPAAPSIEVAESVQLTATAKNSRGTVVTGHSVTWTSSDPTVATVDASGNVAGLEGGTATITAQVDNITGTADITVTDPVRAVAVSAPASSIEVTETVQLSVELQDNAGNVLSGRTVTWTSGDSAIATVNTSGLVTAVAGGTATITAESEGVSDDISITVDNPPRSLEVTPDPAAVDVGSTVQLSATVRDMGGNALSGYSPSWSSDDTSVATVDSSGLVSGQQGGSTTITASVDDGSGTIITGTAGVNVGSPVAVVTLDPASVEIFPGEQAQLNVTLEDANGNVLSGRTVTWTSDDTAIATVDSSGLIDALSPGSTTITAESEGVSGTVALEVLEWIDVSANENYSCGVVSNGDAYCWGENSPDGVLGDGTSDSGSDSALNHDADSNTPSLVQGGHDFAQIAAGVFHTCGLDTSGQAYCWGSNGAGHLGNGTNAPSAVPVAVSGSHTFTEISLGANHACALDTSDRLYCWGSNQSGQLGLGASQGSTVPQRVPSLTFSDFSTGVSHTCGISTSGDTYCWGVGADGQIGNGGTSTVTTPTPVTTTEQFSHLASGWNHTCALNASSHVYCWGSNVYSELGDGNNPSSTPLLADDSRAYSALALGAGTTCAIATNGDAYCWGFNGQGNLGTGSPSSPALSPTLVTGGYTWSLLSPGLQHTCGIASGESDAFCMGDNDFGQVGNGMNQNFLATPTTVLTP
jgi:alpha-tubulin suppressor-like RCC1 family protein